MPTIAAPAAPASTPARRNAFPAPYQLDARRCISYLTIENKGPIPHEFREAIGNRIYGCDDCLAACPWNKFAQAASEAKLAARDDLREPALAELLALDDAAFRTLLLRLAGQAHRPRPLPAQRADRRRQFGRCVRWSAPCARLLGDASPLVRGRGRLGAVAAGARRPNSPSCAAAALTDESDDEVRGRMAAGLPGADRSGSACMSRQSIFIFGAGYSGKAFAPAKPRCRQHDLRHDALAGEIRGAAPGGHRAAAHSTATLTPEIGEALGRDDASGRLHRARTRRAIRC